MVMLFGDQLAAAVASDSSAGWATTLEKNHSKITGVLSRHNVGSQQYGSNQGLLEALGPAIDDEMAAGCTAQLMDERYEAPVHRLHTRATLNAGDTVPVFDPESIQAMVSSLGPAIHEPTIM